MNTNITLTLTLWSGWLKFGVTMISIKVNREKGANCNPWSPLIENVRVMIVIYMCIHQARNRASSKKLGLGIQFTARLLAHATLGLFELVRRLSFSLTLGL